MTTAEPMSEARLAEIREWHAGMFRDLPSEKYIGELLREVDRLRNEVAEMRRSMDGLEYALSEAEAARETTQSRLQQRLAECERDARRYRWLRDTANKGTGSKWADYSFKIPKGCGFHGSHEKMIDAALAADGEGRG